MKNIPIYHYSGLYKIDENGNIFSERKQRYLKPSTNNVGYLMVFLTDRDKLHCRWWSVSRLTCLTYNGLPPTPRHEVNHKDHNKKNNHYTNLEWLTHSENIQKSYDEGYRRAVDDVKYKVGVSPSAGTREKMSLAKWRPVAVEKDGNRYEFDNIGKLCESNIFGFRMYREKFNRIMKTGAEHKGWKFFYIVKQQVIECQSNFDLFVNCEVKRPARVRDKLIDSIEYFKGGRKRKTAWDELF